MEKKIFPWQTKGGGVGKKFGTKHFLFIFLSNGECFPHHLKKGRKPHRNAYRGTMLYVLLLLAKFRDTKLPWRPLLLHKV